MFTSVLRKAVEASKVDPSKNNYIIIYGLKTDEKPYNHSIMEEFNTLCDMNKKLILASNEIIKIAPNMKIVFIMERSCAEGATPAFISRQSIVNLNA